MRINLVYLSDNNTGGWVTFTVHLVKSLEAKGITCPIFKLRATSESHARNFGYGLPYHNTTLAGLLHSTKLYPTILVAVAKDYMEPAQELLDAGAHLVVHDPAEKSSKLRYRFRPWCVRRIGERFVDGGYFIRHPYVRRGPPAYQQKQGVISLSRIDFDKHTEILLDANRQGAGIKIYGAENRLYTKFNIMPKYPEWKQGGTAFPREDGAAFKLLTGALGMADMSLIVGDGGGTQYTTLEAWDASTVPIIHREWVKPNDDMVPGQNCLIVHDGTSLATACIALPGLPLDREKLIAGGNESLERHSPNVIVPRILEWLEMAHTPIQGALL